MVGIANQVLLIHNIGSTNTINLINESSSSTAANRFALIQNIALLPNASIIVWYDGTSSRWRVPGSSTDVSGGGGGGGSGLPVNGAVTEGKWGKIGFRSGYGLLAGHLQNTIAGVPTVSGYQTSSEHGISWLGAATNVGGGLISDIKNLYRNLIFTLTVRWQAIKNNSDSTNIWIGVTSDLTSDFTLSAYPNNKHCLLFGKQNGDSTWRTIRNGGGASPTTSDTKTENETVNKVVITGGTSDMTLKFNNDTTSTYTTTIPSTTEPLGIIIWMNAESSTSKEMRILDVDLSLTWRSGA